MSWKGTAVPNTGLCPDIYLNTNLSVDEVKALLDTIITFTDMGDGFFIYLVSLANYQDGNTTEPVQINIAKINTDYMIAVIYSTGANVVFSSSIDIRGFEGWLSTFNGIAEFGQFNATFTNDFSGNPVGTENDKLSSLFSITPFEEEVTLEGFLTDCCDAVREKEGTVDKILALDIPSRIRALFEGIIEVEELPLPSGWQGTAIPNSGIVENVYFNTNLSVEEVVNILQTLELNSEGVYFILYNQPDTGLPILMTVTHASPEDIWVISGLNLKPLYFISKPMSGIAENAGWQTFDNPVSFNLETSSSTGEDNVGNQNDKLSKIISSSPIEYIESDIDTSKIYYLNQKIGDVYAFLGSWTSIKNMTESAGGKFYFIVVKDKPTENIKISDLNIPIVYGYFVENENDIFIYVDRTGEGNPSWLSVSVVLFEGQATYGGHITDVSEATDPTKYYTMAVQKFYKYSNGWIEYIVPTGTWTVSGVAPYNETIDISKYQYVEINVIGGSGQYTITSNGTYNVENYSSVYVNVVPSGGRYTITSNGVYDISDYTSVDVNVSTSQEDGLLEKTLTTYTNDRVTSIGSYAFNSFSKLTSVDFPNVTIIGANAFNNCSALTSVDFPNVTIIGDRAFNYCSALTSINLPKATSIREYAFYFCSKLTNVDFPQVTSIGNYAFQHCSSLTSVDFPNATSIGNYAFNDCSALTSADFPLVTSIGGSAFASCYSLTKLIIRTTSQVCTLSSTSAFNNCYHILGTTDATYNPQGLKDGYIYVPDELVESYKTATNWVTYADQIKPLSEYVEK